MTYGLSLSAFYSFPRQINISCVFTIVRPRKGSTVLKQFTLPTPFMIVYSRTLQLALPIRDPIQKPEFSLFAHLRKYCFQVLFFARHFAKRNPNSRCFFLKTFSYGAPLTSSLVTESEQTEVNASSVCGSLVTLFPLLVI